MTLPCPEALTAWEAAGEQVVLGDRRLFTRSAGSGPVLVLLHGFPTASYDWHALWPDLSREFRLVTLDLLGFGFSDKPYPHRYRIAEQADLVEALLERQGISDYSLVSHDLGDTVAQELLARQIDGTARQRLHAVCLLNGGLFPETHRPLRTQRLLAGPLGPLLARLIRRERFFASLQAICCHQLPEADLAAFWVLINRTSGRRVMPAILAYMAERRDQRARWVGALSRSPLPVAVICGLQDPISGAHMLARFRELVPAGLAVGLDGLGHYPHVEAPARVLAAMLPFLREHAAVRR